ncbi:Acylamidase [Cupriavidus yeoncheonensis]|uniref:Acylamidase n=1 Tax=Cupriavidus yeoncheonensis TaxID=1462994 RepID=A0A916NFN7_9BURK|nr:amidase [Cupriavidus yeoncheonensis]CAG2155177.1 Acylamidase [Cupriavidus yeoncheonensis]
MKDYSTAHELLSLLRHGDITSVELLRSQLARVSAIDPTINAVAVLDAERALLRAAEADADRASGRNWGPLHGLPITVKESFDVAGLPTTWGYEAFRTNIATRHATAVQRLVDAGAIIFGKTNVPVSLADWQTFNPVYGTTSNPWDASRVPGGSSGGSAAALAAGYTSLELGSDIGASIRNPAHYCGVYGHKPTWGVVPMEGHALPGIACMDSVDIGVAGPMARSAHDLELAMDVLASPAHSFGSHGWQQARWRDRARPVEGLRIAVIADDPVARVDGAIVARLQALASFLRGEVACVSENRRPVDSSESRAVYLHLVRAATGAFLSDEAYDAARRAASLLDPGDMSYRACHYRGSTLTHRDWFALDQRRSTLRLQWDRFFQDYDLLICPVATTTAFPHNQKGERWERMLDVNGHPQESTDSMFWAGYPGVVGLPATAIPLGRDLRGLPFGAQIVAPAFSDFVALRFAQWLAREWYAFQAPEPLSTVAPAA